MGLGIADLKDRRPGMPDLHEPLPPARPGHAFGREDAAGARQAGRPAGSLRLPATGWLASSAFQVFASVRGRPGSSVSCGLAFQPTTPPVIPLGSTTYAA